MNVYDIITESAEKWPSRLAIIDRHGSLSFRDLADRVAELRLRLKELGVVRGSGMGLLAGNDRAFVIGLFAGVGCGATVAPVSHQLKDAEVVSMFDGKPPHVILADGALTRSFTADDAVAIPIGNIDYRLTTCPEAGDGAYVPHIDDAAFLRFTSGTTGRSKGVVLGHRSVLERTESAQAALRLSPEDTMVWVLPMAYHFIVSIVAYMRYGVCMAICDNILAASILSCAVDHHATLFYGSPMHFRMLAADRSGIAMSQLRLAISTSSAIPATITVAFRKRFGIPVTQAFGIIEAGLPMVNTADNETASDAVGRPTPGFSVAVLDDDNEPVTDGSPGQLAVRGPGMFDGYLSPPVGRADVLVNGWFLTGDIAEIAEDGLVRIVGRRKAMINVAGNKVFPEEVEAVLNEHPDIRLSRVYGARHPLTGEIVAADLILTNSDKHIDVEGVINYCRRRLSIYKIPQRLQQVDHIATTGSGKIERISDAM